MTPDLAEHRYQACTPIRPRQCGPDDSNRPIFYIHGLHSGSSQAQHAVLDSTVLARLQGPISSAVATLLKQIRIRMQSSSSQGLAFGPSAARIAQQTSFSSSHSSRWGRTQTGFDQESGQYQDLFGLGRLIHQRDGEQNA